MRPPLRPLVFCLCLPAAGLCQDDGTDNAIRVTTTLHEDGTKTVTQMNPDSHTSEASTYDARDHLRQKIVYALNERNQPESGVVYTPDNKPVFKAAYTRDNLDRVTEEADYTMADQLIRRFVYEFGADGKVSRIRAFDANGVEMQQTEARKDVSKVPRRRRR